MGFDLKFKDLHPTLEFLCSIPIPITISNHILMKTWGVNRWWLEQSECLLPIWDMWIVFPAPGFHTLLAIASTEWTIKRKLPLHQVVSKALNKCICTTFSDHTHSNIWEYKNVVINPLNLHSNLQLLQKMTYKKQIHKTVFSLILQTPFL